MSIDGRIPTATSPDAIVQRRSVARPCGTVESLLEPGRRSFRVCAIAPAKHLCMGRSCTTLLRRATSLPNVEEAAACPRCNATTGREQAQQNTLHGTAYSITSSARASSVCGICKSSALAVLALITNSNLVGCCTGSSPGFSPLRIRAA